VDRTVRNPNLLVWHRRLHLIDHGSALYVHHQWANPDEHARRAFPQSRHHVLLPFAGSIEAADERLAPLVDRPWLEALAAGIPDDCSARRLASPTRTPTGAPTSTTW